MLQRCGIVIGIWACFVGLLTAEAFPPTTHASQPPEPTVPTVTMPEKVSRVWKAAIESYSFAPAQAEDRAKNLAALEHLRNVPWPDFAKLTWLRLTPVAQPDREVHPAIVWCAAQTDTELVLVLPDLTARRVERKGFSKIETVDPGPHLDALVEFLKSRKTDDKRPWDFTFIQDFGAGGLPYYGGVYLLHQAYAAAWLDKKEQAAALIHEALAQQSLAFERAVDEGAWQSFYRGIQMLDGGKPREAVLAQWEQSLKTYPQNRYRDQLENLITQLKVQVGEDAELAKTAVVDPSRLPQDQQIAYYLARLADVHGQQWSQPGHCWTLGRGKETASSDALVKIGRPAVPALIEQLENRRLTRSIGFWRNFAPDRTVLRYQDVAVQCIDTILDIRFYEPSSTSSYLSNEKPEAREKVIAEIKAWWKAHGHETPLQSQLSRLDTGRIYERMETLHKIEKLDPKAIDPIATLKTWAKEIDGHGPDGREQVAYIAEELARRGDLSFLPEMREMIHDTTRTVCEEPVWFVLHWGNAEDYRYLLERSRQELAAGTKLGTASVWGSVMGVADSTDKPIAVPLLVAFLGQREMTGSRYRSGFKQSMSFCAADTCLESLVRLTGHDVGYKGDDPPEQRFAAMDKWLAWWKRQGQAAYIAQHPEVARVLGQQVPVTTSAPAK